MLYYTDMSDGLNNSQDVLSGLLNKSMELDETSLSPPFGQQTKKHVFSHWINSNHLRTSVANLIHHIFFYLLYLGGLKAAAGLTGYSLQEHCPAPGGSQAR